MCLLCQLGLRGIHNYTAFQISNLLSTISNGVSPPLPYHCLPEVSFSSSGRLSDFIERSDNQMLGYQALCVLTPVHIMV